MTLITGEGEAQGRAPEKEVEQSTAVATDRRHRWTLESYELASGANALQGRTELIDGEILDMMVDGDPHRVAVSYVMRQLFLAFPQEEFLVTGQSSARLDATNVPSPDAMVEIPQPIARGTNVLVKPLLIVEVSDTTLLYDQVAKSSLYASQSVADYWLLNLADGQLEVYRKPVADASRKFGWRYSGLAIIRPPDLASPLVKPDVRIEVARMLP